MMLTMLNPFAAKATPIDGKTAMSLVASEDALLVDVREPSELSQGGRARDAVNIPLAALARQANPARPDCHPSLRTDRAVILYCATGSRSSMAGKVMRALGYAKVYDMGPLSAWAAAGGKVAR